MLHVSPRVDSWPTQIQTQQRRQEREMVFGCYMKFVSAVGLMGAVYFAYYKLCEKYHRLRKYRLVGLVTELHCYPVASCMGLSTSSAICTKKGLQVLGISDRQFVITKTTGEDFSRLSPQGTTKQYFSPIMREMEAYSDGLDLNLTAPHDTFVHSLKLTINKASLKQFYRAENLCIGADMGVHVNRWLERVLHTPNVKLCYCIDQLKTVTPGRSNFGNYVITTQESIDYVNQKTLPRPPLMSSYFRPNIVISGCAPFEENKWKVLCIGDEVYLKRACADVRVICTPYSFQSVDSNFKPSWEPHKDIRGVSTVSGMNFFETMGLNAMCLEEGKINIGDPVFAAI